MKEKTRNPEQKLEEIRDKSMAKQRKKREFHSKGAKKFVRKRGQNEGKNDNSTAKAQRNS